MLYEFTHEGSTVYGTKLAVNSEGTWVMEVKGSGNLVAIDRKNAKEVVPPSVGIRFDAKGTVYHYLVDDKTQFEVGDMLVIVGTGYSEGGFCIVEVASLSNSGKATKPLVVKAKLGKV